MPDQSEQPAETIAALGEFALIDRIRQWVTASQQGVGQISLGIGDDTAIFRPRSGWETLVTCDAVVEGRHYLSELTSMYQLGRRAMAMNLSDVGAMGGESRCAVISLGLRPDTPVRALEELYRGFLDELAPAGVALAGGNLTAVPDTAFMSITLLGEVEQGRALRRDTAQIGDAVLLTGYPGMAAGGLALLQSAAPAASLPANALTERYLTPQHRAPEGRAVGRSGLAHAMIDVSDGLMGDLGHLCRASSVGVDLNLPQLPAHPELLAAATQLQVSPLDWVLGASDDYELLVTCAPAAVPEVSTLITAVRGAPATRIGEVTAGNTVILRDDAGRPVSAAASGWDHFRMPPNSSG